MQLKTKLAVCAGEVMAAKSLSMTAIGEDVLDAAINQWVEEVEHDINSKDQRDLLLFVKEKLDDLEKALPKDVWRGRESVKHESYGMLSFSRTTHGGDCHLFGSDIGHRNTIQMSLKRASHRRELNTDWYYGGAEIVRVEMSGSQFAEAISCMNVGDGVPVTLNRVMGLRMEDPPFISKADLHRSEFENEVREVNEKTKELISEVESLFEKKSFTKKDKEEILRKLNKLYQFSSSNEAFHVDSFQRMADQTVTSAKAEIEAFALNKVLTIGQQALVQNAEGFPSLPDEINNNVVESITDGG